MKALRLALLVTPVALLMSAAKGQWTPMAYGMLPPGHLIIALDAVDESTVWAVSGDLTALMNGAFVGHQPIVLRTTDGGETWSALEVGVLAGNIVYSMVAVSADEVYFTYWGQGFIEGVYYTLNGGASWSSWTPSQMQNSGGLHLVRFNELEWFAMSERYSAASSDGGGAWSTVQMPAFPSNEYIIFESLVNHLDVQGDRIMIPSNRGRFRVSQDRGATWELANTPFTGNRSITSVSFHDAMNGLAVSTWSTSGQALPCQVLVTNDGGASWEVRNGPGRAMGNVEAVPGVPGAYIGSAFVLDPQPGTYLTLDHGASWVALDTTQYFNSIEFLSASSGWIGLGAPAVDDLTPAIFKWNGGQVGIKPAEPAGRLAIAPNPTRGTLPRLQTRIPLERADVLVHDSQGRCVQTWPAQRIPSEGWLLPVHGLAAGCYSVSVVAAEGRFASKLMLE